MDVDTNSLWHVLKIPFVLIRLARPRILHKRFFNTRTERMATTSLDPFRSFPCSLEGVKTRPHNRKYHHTRYVPTIAEEERKCGVIHQTGHSQVAQRVPSFGQQTPLTKRSMCRRPHPEFSLYFHVPLEAHHKHTYRYICTIFLALCSQRPSAFLRRIFSRSSC